MDDFIAGEIRAMTRSNLAMKPPEIPPDLAEKIARSHLAIIGGQVCTGSHVLVEIYKAKRTLLTNAKKIEEILRRAAQAAGATVLSVHLHPFEGAGLAGAALLAESHLTIHTWPELSYAALDGFMCGQADPRRALPVFREFGGQLVSEFRIRGNRIGEFL